MFGKFVLALDQGTTVSHAVLFDHNRKIVGTASREIAQIYPKTGWVEHDPMQIWGSLMGSAIELLEKTRARPEDLAAIGVTNQRETTVVWDKETGKPIYNAIVWNCRRTEAICDDLKAKGLDQYIQEATGLVVDAYFSATKLKWILDNVDGARERAQKGELLFGNIDTWLIWKLTRGKVHATDYSNASRTMLFNIGSLKWDQQILDELNVPACMLPEVKPSSFLYGYTDPKVFGGAMVPISGDAGDQQAALFGQACFGDRIVNSTYGTSCFILMNTGEKRVPSKNGLLTTIAWGVNGKVEYALEGNIFVAGAAVQWLRDEMKIIDLVAESEKLSMALQDSNGVHVVPAFNGLGAPYWDMHAHGAIVGLTHATNRDHIVRATLESIAFRTRDILLAIEENSGLKLRVLKADGAAAENNFLMQFQSDILNVPVERAEFENQSALGVALLAGLAVGFWGDKFEFLSKRMVDRTFIPLMNEVDREKRCNGWEKAVECSRVWGNVETSVSTP